MHRLILTVISLAFTALLAAPASAQDVRSSMNDLQQNALKDGCWKRYSGNERKRYACLNAEAYWQNALRDGCYQRYSGNGSKLDRCLNTSNLGGYYGGQRPGGDGYYGNDGRYSDGYYGNDPYDDGPYDNRYGNRSNNSGGGYYGGSQAGGGASGLTDVQQNALKDGCWQRYSGNDRKRYACLNGEAYWRDALRDGCWKRYNGNQGKLDRCLRY